MNRTTTLLLALTSVATITTGGCAALGSGNATGAPAGTTSAAPAAPGGLLDQLGPPVPEDATAPYKRADWGDWVYDPKTKCSRREEILIRDGQGELVDAACRSTCPAATASPAGPACWTSRYDDVAVYDVALLQADHIVPLAEAARSGARNWAAARRAEFYNDPANLVMVTGKSNGRKSDNDPAKYKPVRGYWCEYATAYAKVKIAFGLSVDAAEKTALAGMLDTCGGAPR
jgi:hypothetical protein